MVATRTFLRLAALWMLALPMCPACDGTRYAVGEVSADSEPGTVPEPGDDAWAAADESEPTIPGVGECELVPQWAVGPEEFELVYGSPTLSLSPSQTLLLRSGGYSDTFFRVRDGARLGHDNEWSIASPDALWRTQLRTTTVDAGGYAEVIDLASGEVTLTIPALPSPSPELTWLRQFRGLVVPNGTGVVLVTCWSGPGADAAAITQVASYALPGGQAGPMVELPMQCESSWPDLPRATVSTSGRYVVLGAPGDPHLALVDLESADAATRDVLGGAEVKSPINGTGYSYYDAPIQALAISPQEDRVAVVDYTGKLSLLTLPGLESAGPTRTVATVGINQYTYGPSAVSPVAWSADGTRLAHLDAEGEAVITDAATGETLVHIPRPSAGTPSWAGPELFNPATSFAFTADGQGLVVSFEVALGYWRCADSESPTVDGELAVSVSGPAQMLVQQQGEYRAKAATSGQAVVYSLYIDGKAKPAFGNLSGVFELSFYEPGSHELLVVVDDGSSAIASEPFIVDVL